uniref:Neurexin-1-like n=1 Tax=Camelus bactrianus TaxID=9837 RepID=A0A9W3GCD0_CAMBA|nr:neurexin-1-like [Camelus bactrianus]
MGTALLQRGGCFLLCLSLLLLGCWAELGSGLEFPGAEGQWTRFPKWNACCESEMSFQLKTRSARGLVLYFDDEGFCDFLELILTRGAWAAGRSWAAGWSSRAPRASGRASPSGTPAARAR